MKKALLIGLIGLISLIFFLRKAQEKPALSQEAQKTIQTYQQKFPAQVQNGPIFVPEKNLFGQTERYKVNFQ